jgi:hypothetical protein
VESWLARDTDPKARHGHRTKSSVFPSSPPNRLPLRPSVHSNDQLRRHLSVHTHEARVDRRPPAKTGPNRKLPLPSNDHSRHSSPPFRRRPRLRLPRQTAPSTQAETVDVLRHLDNVHTGCSFGTTRRELAGPCRVKRTQREGGCSSCCTRRCLMGC